ncbi:DNA helicase-2/ATP-dependent DNA helicase PcrA [Tepidicella xavieri]|uniref:DNA 3'-5' helicase n=2 Tax=Tepidicella xavieri TaxID=360241 RepID=A0A4R6UDQ5_9BURK|nr:DNA helicase-2/ATP-dependent DNA helicase PcrA [Tepidicella xavieri]
MRAMSCPASTDPARSPLLQALNPEQLAAVTLPAAHALILAGAGSGKTRVLTTRIAWLLSTGQVTAGGIMAVTFTNKAAKEMLTRLQAMLPLNVRGMWIGTFHGLCHRLLRAHWKLAALPQTFQILDTQDQLSAIKRLVKQQGLDEEQFKPKELQWFIAHCKEEGLRPHQIPIHDEDHRRKVEMYQLYEAQCQREGVVDFGELMLRSFELLRDQPALREHYQQRFRHILIDEFQDTNRLQYAWLKQLAGHEEQGRFVPGSNAVLAVGDDDQSIYAFRGARVGNMADFVREFGVRHQIKLEQNYRSHGHILDAANHLIDHNRSRLGKQLRTDQGAGEPLRVYEAPTDFAEAQWIVDEIRHLVKNDGLPRQEVAILYRSNAQSRVLESALFNAGVPYRVYGGLRFFERAEIKHALAYLRLLDNPHDDTSFLRVANFPPRGIGARTLEQLQDRARSRGCSLHDAVEHLGGAAATKLRAFVAKIDVMREATAGATLRQIIDIMLQHSGLLAHYRDDRDGADRVENLEELVNAAESFVMQEGFGRDAVALPLDETASTLAVAGQSPVSQGLDPTAALLDLPLSDAVAAETGETVSPLVAFLTHAALESGDNQAQAGQDAVQLMTVHAAKGLEFDAVFIAGLEEGLFPHENSLSNMDGLEEERRLMYVAITRARKRLYLTHAQTRMLHGQTRYHLRSRFFDELPEHCLKWLTPPSAGWGAGERGSPWGAAPSRVGMQPAWGRSGLAETGFTVPASARQTASPAQAAAPHGIRAGMQVFHPKFGEGKVLTVEGQGDDARAQVSFMRHGSKWLALSVAKLTPI